MSDNTFGMEANESALMESMLRKKNTTARQLM